MKIAQKIFFLFQFCCIVFACTTKKDTIITRNYHALTSKYNILFNGNVALEKGVQELNEKYQDDWFKRLPIEPIEFQEDKVMVPEINSAIGGGFDTKRNSKDDQNKASTPFDIAEEKAVKTIQRHGMNIDDLERNIQIDDAYLLLGKGRYYTQRFIPAIEAFNYVITKYPNADLIAETKIWRAKANIRLDNEEFALESLNLLLNIKDTLEVDLPDVIKEQAHTTLAMAYEKLDSTHKVKKHLRLGSKTQKNKQQSARNLFILGQIYQEENKKDSAFAMFYELSERKKAPYKYKIFANIALAQNTTNDTLSDFVIKKLSKLIANRDNKAYLDALYYQVGALKENKDSINQAIAFYNKSLRQDGGAKQKTFTYQRLGEIHFNKDDYLRASAYYDSVLRLATDTLALRIRRVKRKYKNLASLISFENTITKNDSILKLVAFSKDEQTAYFQKYIDSIKEKDEDDAQLKLNQLAFGDAFGGNSLQSTSGKGKWYFYNSQSLSYGKTEFRKIWGSRKLADGWRWSSKAIVNKQETDSLQTTKVNPRYDLEKYLSSIPSKKEVIDTLKIERNNALYELGIIYKEQFKNPSLAIKKLERVATMNTNKTLVLPIYWHLYQAYKRLEKNTETKKYGDFIVENYPETIFANRIKNPKEAEVKTPNDISDLDKTYREIYYAYKENEFKGVIRKINELLPSIQNSELIPKFELLKAYAIGKYGEKESYKKALEFVLINYGNTEEGKKAKEIIVQLSK